MKKNRRKKELRIFQRHPMRKSVGIATGKTERVRNRPLNDISLGGVSFRSAAKIVPGTTVVVRFNVGGAELKSTGKVRWVTKDRHGYNVGAEFTDPRYTTRARMISGLRKR